MATSGTRPLPARSRLRSTHWRTVESKKYPTILAPYRRPDSMRIRRSSTVGFVLSTTTGEPSFREASISCACLLLGFLLLRKRSLLTCSWVAANRSRKNVLFPEACKPTRITSSRAACASSSIMMIIVADVVFGAEGDPLCLAARAGWEDRGREPSFRDLGGIQRASQGRHGAPPVGRGAPVRRQRVPEVRRHLGGADAGARFRRAFPEEPSPGAAALDHARTLSRPLGDEERGRLLARRTGRHGLLVPPAADLARVERAPGEEVPQGASTPGLRRSLQEPA